MEEESREVRWNQTTKELECLAVCRAMLVTSSIWPWSSMCSFIPPLNQHLLGPPCIYGCDELQVYTGGENSLILAIIFALLGLTVQRRLDVITHNILLSMTLGRSPGVGNATAVFLPGKFHGQRSLADPRVRHDRVYTHRDTHTHTYTHLAHQGTVHRTLQVGFVSKSCLFKEGLCFDQSTPQCLRDGFFAMTLDHGKLCWPSVGL